MAHCRRPFFELHASEGSPLALDALQRIAALYAIEDQIRGQPPEVRLRVRQAQSAPLFANMRTWLEQTLTRVSGKSPIAGAIRYMLTRWDAVTLILRDGQACIDNNAAERAMRPIPLGRKNWLHAGPDEAASCCPSGYVLIRESILEWIVRHWPSPPAPFGLSMHFRRRESFLSNDPRRGSTNLVSWQYSRGDQSADCRAAQ